MKFITGPRSALDSARDESNLVLLYEREGSTSHPTAGWATAELVRRRRLEPSPIAWDLVSIALSVVVADGAQSRASSPDGWTREFELDIALNEPERWRPHAAELSDALNFLTTDRWTLRFVPGGHAPIAPKKPWFPDAQAALLLSGGLDSLVGAIDLTAQGKSLLAISQTVRGDAHKQVQFADIIGGAAHHLQLNHNASTSRAEKETSQRSRSLIFLAFAVLGASSVLAHHCGETVPIFVCENGLIALNPPLTLARIGSLSTRTAHPEFLGRMQRLLDALGLKVRIENPYAQKTKGEMLAECLDQDLLATEAVVSTSCGRFQRFNYTHCGRCVPCQIRRASFLRWDRRDTTEYVYDDLGRSDSDHAGFDDVMAVRLAHLAIEEEGLDRWLGTSLTSTYISDTRVPLRDMLERGMNELKDLHSKYGLV